jgi:hypothetical protein
MSVRYSFPRGIKVEGTPSIAALRASYAVVSSTSPQKELLPGLRPLRLHYGPDRNECKDRKD